jgi:hypothetical protein
LSRQVLQHEVLSRLRTVTGVLYFEPAVRTSRQPAAKKNEYNCVRVVIRSSTVCRTLGRRQRDRVLCDDDGSVKPP